MAAKKYSKKKLAFFKKHIEAKLKNLTDDLDVSRDSLESSTGSDSLAQESVYSVHMADAGTDSYEREKGYHFINRKTDYIKVILWKHSSFKDTSDEGHGRSINSNIIFLRNR